MNQIVQNLIKLKDLQDGKSNPFAAIQTNTTTDGRTTNTNSSSSENVENSNKNNEQSTNEKKEEKNKENTNGVNLFNNKSNGK